MLDKGIGTEKEATFGTPGNITALLYASANGLNDIVKILLDKGANVNYDGFYYRSGCGNDCTPLFMASLRGYTNIVKMLLDRDPDVSFTGREARRTALDVAAIKGHTEIMEMLIKKGAVKASK